MFLSRFFMVGEGLDRKSRGEICKFERRDLEDLDEKIAVKLSMFLNPLKTNELQIVLFLVVFVKIFYGFLMPEKRRFFHFPRPVCCVAKKKFPACRFPPFPHPFTKTASSDLEKLLFHPRNSDHPFFFISENLAIQKKTAKFATSFYESKSLTHEKAL